MGRLFLCGVFCLLAALSAASVAEARTIVGTRKGQLLIGTPKPDIVIAKGSDERIAVEGGGSDRVTCKRGGDIVTADLTDKIGASCKVVSRQISRDPYRNSGSQHQTEVEPDSFAAGSTMVAGFQVGRFFDGGSDNIGFSTTTNGGGAWTHGFLPGVTTFSVPSGSFPRVSDPTVTYDAAHAVWLLASLAFSSTSNSFIVNRSRNGLDWQAPVTVLGSTLDLGFDKDWVACDNWPMSPFYGRCYYTYADFTTRELDTVRSTDGGLTWSGPVPSPPFPESGELNGTQPFVLPNGTFAVAYSANDGAPAVSVSTDGGLTFSAGTEIGPGDAADVPKMRWSTFSSAGVDAGGTAYVVWPGCGLRSGCSGNDLLVVSSRDAKTWSAPARIPTGSTKSGYTYFLPGLGADPTSPGALGLTYYSMPPCGCRLDAGLVTSADGGSNWSAPQRLDARSMNPSWLAPTSLGLMVGDYVATSFVGGRAVAIFALASAPSGSSLREAIFATTKH